MKQLSENEMRAVLSVGNDTVCPTTGMMMQDVYADRRGSDPMSVVRTLSLDDRDELKRALETLGHACASNSCVNGFWDRVNVPEKVALIASEVSEAIEALREPMLKMSDKIPPHSNFAEELADVIIRVMDLDAIFGLDLAECIANKMDANSNRPRQHGGKRF